MPTNATQATEYIVQCWTCLGEFDALDSVWCGCDPKNPTRLCPFCLQCFCSSTDDYKTNFWKSSPAKLKNEVSLLQAAKGQLGEMLIRSNMLTTDQLIKALEYQKIRNCRLGEALVGLGFSKQADIDYFLTRQDTVSTVSLGKDFELNKELFVKLPPKFCYEKSVLPMEQDNIKDDTILTVAFANPKDSTLVDLVQTKADCKIISYKASDAKIKLILERAFSKEELNPPEPIKEVDIKKLVKDLILGGIKNKATDFYIEPKEENVQISFRIDGMLFRHKPLPIKLRDYLLREIRAMVGLKDLSAGGVENRSAVLKHQGKKYELNLQSFPNPYGENISIKIIDRANFFKDLDDLGMVKADTISIKRSLSGTSRVLLITGPVMNGTATTLYSFIRFLTQRGRRVSSLEDPILTPLEDVQQIQVSEDQFAKTLQSLLQTNPEVIALTDIPDGETAKIAFRMGGNLLVVASMEAMNSTDAILELSQLGLSPRELAYSLGLVINQRLVRKICPHCRKESPVMKNSLEKAGLSEKALQTLKTYAGDGCDKCRHTGYLGRLPLFEILNITDTVKDAISKGKSGKALSKIAVSEGMISIKRHCLTLVHQGVTTFEEFERSKF